MFVLDLIENPEGRFSQTWLKRQLSSGLRLFESELNKKNLAINLFFLLLVSASHHFPVHHLGAQEGAGVGAGVVAAAGEIFGQHPHLQRWSMGRKWLQESKCSKSFYVNCL